MKILFKKLNRSFVNSYWNLIKEGGLYAIINILDRIVPFILLPLIIRSVSIEEFGIYSLFLSIESFLVPIVTLNIHGSISKQFYDDDINLKIYNSSIIFSLPFLFVIFALILLIIPEKLIESF